MKFTFHEMYFDIEKSIDYAFNGKFVLNLYDYLKSRETKKKDVDDFINSTTAQNIRLIVNDLNDYLEGGSDNIHKQLREAYGHIPKPQARKIKNYLNKIIEDAEKYIYEKRPGRRKKQPK